MIHVVNTLLLHRSLKNLILPSYCLSKLGSLVIYIFKGRILVFFCTTVISIVLNIFAPIGLYNNFLPCFTFNIFPFDGKRVKVKQSEKNLICKNGESNKMKSANIKYLCHQLLFLLYCRREELMSSRVYVFIP